MSAATATQPANILENTTEHLKQYADKAKEVLHTANNTSLAEVEKNVGTFVRDNPGRCLAAAAITGFALGFLARR